MNNELPENSWRDKLLGYSSPVDNGILKKVMDARKEDRDHPFSFWIYLSIIFFFMGLTLVLSENKEQIESQGPLYSIPSDEPPPAIHSSPQGKINDTKSQTGLLTTNNKQAKDSTGAFLSGKIAVDSTFTTLNHTDQGIDFISTGLKEKNVSFTRLLRRNVRRAQLSYVWAPPKSYSLPPLFEHGKERLDQQSNTMGVLKIPDCPNINSNGRNDWYVEVFGAFDMPMKTLKGTTSKSDFTDQKDSTEKFLLSWSAGMRISKNISNSWLIKTGLHYSQFNEKFLYQNEKERRITTIVTIRSIIRAPGDTIYLADSTQVEVTGVRVKNTYNSYRNLDIPLLLSYEVRNPGLTIAVQGGTIFNMSSRFTGDMLDTTGLPMAQSGKNPASQFKNSLGFGIYAGASVIKSISNEVDVFAEPYYRRYLNNQATEAAPFQQHLSNWGIQLGLRYRLNKDGQRY